MSQHRIAIDGYDGVQPTEFSWNFETTSTEDSTRAMNGATYITPLFTVESFSVSYEGLSIGECSRILNAIVQRPGKVYFNLHYFSPYYGEWRTGQFYVGKGSLKIKTLVVGEERIQDISAEFVGKDKLI